MRGHKGLRAIIECSREGFHESGQELALPRAEVPLALEVLKKEFQLKLEGFERRPPLFDLSFEVFADLPSSSDSFALGYCIRVCCFFKQFFARFNKLSQTVIRR